MKIAILMGRGIEGCGVTRAAINFKQYFDINKIECNIYASKDKVFPRRKNQKNEIIEFTNEEIINIKEKLNTCDFVYYFSLPSKSHSQEYCELFEKELVDGIVTKKIIIQHDHKIQSLNRNYNIWGITGKMDLAFNFDKNSPFSKKASFLGINIIEMINGFNFEDYKKYIKPIESLKKKISYLGRFALFKEPIRVIQMHDLLLENGYEAELRGVERSIGALNIFYSDIKNRIYRSNIKTKKDNEEFENGYVNIYGPYMYEDGLEVTSNSMFGANFYNIKVGGGRHVEFATLEIAAIGCIPIVDKGRAENTERKDGIKYSEIKDGFILSDKDNLQDTINQMNELSNDLLLLQKRREKCLSILQEVFDINKAYGELYKNTIYYFDKQ